MPTESPEVAGSGDNERSQEAKFFWDLWTFRACRQSAPESISAACPAWSVANGSLATGEVFRSQWRESYLFFLKGNHNGKEKLLEQNCFCCMGNSGCCFLLDRHFLKRPQNRYYKAMHFHSIYSTCKIFSLALKSEPSRSYFKHSSNQFGFLVS